MKYKMVGCDILPEEKIILVYKDSYISPELRAEKEKQGWRVIEGGEKLDRFGNSLPHPSFPLQSSASTAREEK